MIRLIDASKRYGKTLSLHPLSAHIPSGTIVALCGSNGAGKSTLLNLLNGTTRTSTGSVEIAGEAVNTKRTRARFGYMPDDFEFDPSLSVRETLTYYGLLQGVKELPEQLLGRVGLTEHVGKRTDELSKGMRQRLLLAQALLTEPELLLLDEPTNGLDPHWIRELARLLEEERARGTTIVFSTHQLDVAAEIADEVWVLQDGVVLTKIQGGGETERYRQLRTFF